MKVHARSSRPALSCYGSLAVVFLFVVGCSGHASFHHRVDRLKPGTPVDEALLLIPGNPSLRQIEGLPDIAIYDYGDCSAWEGCQGESLVFDRGRFHGRSLKIHALRNPEYLTSGTTREEFGRYGVIPSRIVRASGEGPDQEAWIFEYDVGIQAKRQLIVYFRENRLVNWIDLAMGSSIPTPELSHLPEDSFDFFLAQLLEILILWPR
jgi:hypothetical protein